MCTVTGSPQSVFASRDSEASASKARATAFKELQEQKLAKAKKAAEARKSKKAADDAKFKARQEGVRAKEAREAEEAKEKRKEGLRQIETEHQRWQEEQEALERAMLKASGVLGSGESFPVPNETYTSMEVDETLVHAYTQSVQGLYAQRALDEANEAQRQAKMKGAASHACVWTHARARRKRAARLANPRGVAFRPTTRVR